MWLMKRMRGWWRRGLLDPLLLVLVAPLVDAMTARSFRFSALRPGDETVVAYRITGCFLDDWAQIRFTRTEEGLTFVSTRLTSHGPRSRAGVLDERDVARLDARMRSFRGRSTRSCAITENIRLTVFRNGAPIRREAVMDAMCAWAEPVLPLQTLLPPWE